MRTKLLIANVRTVEKVIGLVSNVRNPQVEPQPEHYSTTNASLYYEVYHHHLLWHYCLA